jgi:peptidoglycan/xylan/chitin deacetylase (PgdA/CDA1 family)
MAKMSFFRVDPWPEFCYPYCTLLVKDLFLLDPIFKNVIFIGLFLLLAGLLGCRGHQPAASVGSQIQVAPPITPARPVTVTARPTALRRPLSLVAPEPEATGSVLPVSHGDRSRPYLALSLDACQSPYQQAGYDQAVINILSETGTPATLFLGGLWMQRHPAQTKALAANPLFELGNHSWSHADFSTLTAEEMSQEIERTQAIMRSLTGQTATLFRFPGGSYAEESLVEVGQHGLQAVQWDVAPGDPDPNVSARAIVEQITGQAQNGSIIVLHMNGWGHHTAQALPTVIKALREQGFTFVPVSELLKKGAQPGE